ncbi:Calcineurin-like phosphoesterase [Hymenobacter gelipurpurascens]|uniref:Calcineurin-like phosphoesterase n=1 Tax=Hymenobacter gelipurpurascens TaxID=89968 RepID=A0A212UF14_9BACT|nr:metallophosphoesterase [Hymenobacter gelipurpurascens]SNC76827.1 Calcineurin-like phosphoesterase [Hymenobacter gelipurpurascens]
MLNRWGLWSWIVALAGLTGCAWVEYSPNQTYVLAAERAQTAQALARLQQRPRATSDTVRFAFVGDTQRFYDETEAFVASVNQQRALDFVFVAGDISDFGLTREFRWVHQRLQQLRVPYLTVIGNHDLVGNGRAIYQAFYGPLNYTFQYGGTRFICLDTNGREYGFGGMVPNLTWLRKQLADTLTAQRTVVLSHVPPTDEDFDPQLVPAYTEALRGCSQLVFHLSGHVHRFTAGQPFHDGVTYLTTYSLEKRRYHIISVWGQRQYRVETVTYGPKA